MTGLAILGATGSVGRSTLDVVRRNAERFRITALTARRNVAGMAELCREFRPEVAVMADEACALALETELGPDVAGTRVLGGDGALAPAVTGDDTDYVMAAIVGGAGLLPTLAAARAGKRVLLANKEAVVMSGGLLMDAVAESGATLLPIDSEHNAIFQCLPPPGARNAEAGIHSIVLTASGGPFLEAPLDTLDSVTPAQACAHPNWEMGRKISVDSATMMNKGLEVIEACCLFGVTPADVEVVVHPQSVVHSMVRYRDGSVLAQLGHPDMRTPIAHALAWPERIESGVAPLDLVAAGRLDFRAPDHRRFPCLRLASDAARAGGGAPLVLNAANEVAVAAFLQERIPFTRIPAVIEHTLDACEVPSPGDCESILAADAEARRYAREKLRDWSL